MRQTLRLPELDTLACGSCGASLELTALAEHATCAHCGGQQAVASDVRERLSSYFTSVQEQLPKIVASLDDADLFAFRHAAETKRNLVVAVFGVGVLALWCVAPFGVFFSDDQTTRDLFGMACFGVPMLGLPLVALINWLTRDSTRKKKRYHIRLPDVPVRCSGCGGDNVMPGGTGTTSCAYCRAPMVASPTKIASVLDAVKGFRHAAGLKKHATRRDKNGPRANVPLAYRGNAEWYRKTTAGIYEDPRWEGSRAWLGNVASKLGGTFAEGDDNTRWLDEHFAGEHPPTATGWSHPRGGVTLERGGLPVQIEVARMFHGTRAAADSVAVLIATGEPHEGADADAPTRQALLASGFELFISRGGLFAAARAETSTRLLEGADPSAEVGQIVDALLALASRMQLEPAPPPRALPEPS